MNDDPDRAIKIRLACRRDKEPIESIAARFGLPIERVQAIIDGPSPTSGGTNLHGRFRMNTRGRRKGGWR